VEHYYTAKSWPRISDEAWGSVPAVVKEATIGATLDHVGSYVSSAAAGGGFDAPEATLTRSPVTVDEQGWRALAQELETMTQRIRAIEAESEKRLGQTDQDVQRDASVVLMLFEAPSADAEPTKAAAPGAGGARKRRAKNGAPG
jgi:hypothetical protein